MTAACRAMETERPDGWVRDPLAARLAGERGMAIARALPGLEIMCFGVGMRSRILDDTILTAISQHGISTVLCVGAGLDTRPWRLELPAELLWVEVDLPAMLEYKAEILASDEPRCRLERVAADLNDAGQRSAMFAAAGTGPSLMITEGLLMYLPATTVEALAAEAAAAELSAVRYWLLDLATADLSRAVQMDKFQDVEAMRAKGNLDGEGIVEVLGRRGWVALEQRTYGAYAMKMMPPGRLAGMKMGEMPPPPPKGDLSGVHLYGRG